MTNPRSGSKPAPGVAMPGEGTVVSAWRFGGRALAAGLFAVAAMGSMQPARSAPAVTIGGAFSLAASDGTRVTDQTYRGKWLLVYFGYTSCPDLCPTTLLDISATLQALGSDAAAVQPLFITLDPERDTPEVMRDYVRSFDARIVGLTGQAHEVDAAVQAYGAYVARHEPRPDDGSYLVDHSNAVYLMNPQGAFVRAFDSDWSGERIAATLREIMARHATDASSERGAAGR